MKNENWDPVKWLEFILLAAFAANFLAGMMYIGWRYLLAHAR